MRAMWLLAAATLAGCSNLLDIHALPDAGGDDDDAPPMIDAAMIDAFDDGSVDPDASIDAAMIDAPMIDARPIDAAMIDAPMIDAPPTTDAAVDAVPIDAGTITIGEYAVLGSMATINGNFVTARRFTVGGTTVITAAGAYLKFEPTNGHVKFAIYNDNANAPYTRRALTADITLDGVAGYEEIAIGPHTLPAGTYWMVMATDMSVDIGSMDTNNVYGAAQSLPYSSAFPTTYNPQPVSTPSADRVNLYLQAMP
jgi:hypothetical protein